MYLTGNLSPQASPREPNEGVVFFMINDLGVENPRLWISVDDTTISETVAKGELSNAQRTTDRVVLWSLENIVHLNTDKCKEMRISFTKSQQEFEPILINGDALEVVDSLKLLDSVFLVIWPGIFILMKFLRRPLRDYIAWCNLRELKLLALI